MKICPICGNKIIKGRCARCTGAAIQNALKRNKEINKGKRKERQIPTRTFKDTLDGSWQGKNRLITFSTLDNPRSIIIQVAGEQQYHKFTIINQSHSSAKFLADHIKFEISINNQGWLTLKTDEEEEFFLFVHEGRNFLTCPNCFGKTPSTKQKCRNCYHQFS